MSFKNYQNNNFINNQSISYQELNNLNSNDVILNNVIKNMPRGVIAFQTGFVLETFDTSLNFLIDDETDSGYEILRLDYQDLIFTVENFRLLRFSFFCPCFVDSYGSYFITARSNAENPPKRGRGILEMAFFMKENQQDKYLLNSTFRTSQIFSTAPQGAIFMTYTGTLPAGTHALSVGLKGNRSLLRFGQDDSGNFYPCQIYVEDLGAYNAPGGGAEI